MVTGIGGVIFKTRHDHTALASWYQNQLGIALDDFGAAVLNWQMDPDGSRVELWEPQIWDEKNSVLQTQPTD